jgi:hypothetical protein
MQEHPKIFVDEKMFKRNKSETNDLSMEESQGWERERGLDRNDNFSRLTMTVGVIFEETGDLDVKKFLNFILTK